MSSVDEVSTVLTKNTRVPDLTKVNLVMVSFLDHSTGGICPGFVLPGRAVWWLWTPSWNNSVNYT